MKTAICRNKKEVSVARNNCPYCQKKSGIYESCYFLATYMRIRVRIAEKS